MQRTTLSIDFEGVKAVLEIMTDLTDHKKTKELTLQSIKDWEDTFHNITDMITIHDKDFNIILFNKAAEKTLGLPLLEETKVKCYEYYHGKNHPPEQCPSCECIKTGKSAGFEMYEPHLNKFIEIRAMPRFDSNNQLIGLIHIVRDITNLKKVEEALKSKNAKLQTLMDGLALTGIGVFIVETGYRILHHNKTLEIKFGNLTGKLCYEEYMGNKAPCITCPMKNVVEREKIQSIELTGKDGKYYEILSAPILNSAGGIDKVIEVIRDITKRKQIEGELIKHREKLAVLVEEKTSELTSAIELLREEIMERRKTEEALRESEKRYRGLFNYMSSGVAVYEAIENGKDFVFKDFNKAGEQIDNINKKKLLGKKVTEAFPGIRGMGLLEVFQRVWKTGKPEHHPVSFYKDQRISGWRENYVYKLPSGEIVAVYNDVTEHMKSLERESELLTELKTIFENFPVGIVYLDDNFKVISSNKFFNNFSGFREEELIGKLCYEIIGEYSNDPTKKGHEKICSFCKKEICFKIKRPTIMERPLGDKFIRVTTIPELNENGNIFRFMEIIEDITERKLAEAEAIRANHLAALGELAAGVAHEINNPISGIINYAQILSNKINKGSKEHDIANRILKESDRIANIVTGLLSFARDSKEEKRPVHIHEITSDSLALTETQIKKDGIKLKVNITPDLPRIIAQPQQIEQVFLNIISNAREALNQKYPNTHKDKILDITAKEAIIDNNPYIQIKFYDKGIGIPPEIIDKIMNPFFTTKSTAIGTGLGLSISHGIISDHGGKITIKSIKGKFTKVIINLPVKKMQNENNLKDLR